MAGRIFSENAIVWAVGCFDGYARNEVNSGPFPDLCDNCGIIIGAMELAQVRLTHVAVRVTDMHERSARY